MNRRSFITGILAACAAPAVLLPKLKDHARWQLTRRNDLWIAEPEMVFNDRDFCGTWQFVADNCHQDIYVPAQT